MEITYYIESEFACVYLINGVFRETAGLFDYPKSSPLYITALPLKALLLPYTIKITGGVALDNENLIESYKVGDDKFVVKLKERHNYVYSPIYRTTSQSSCGVAYDLFSMVKLGKLDVARSYLTNELNNCIDDDSLIGFFQPFTNIFTNKFPDINAGYLLIAEKKCEAYNFTFSGNLIDNIEQVEF